MKLRLACILLSLLLHSGAGAYYLLPTRLQSEPTEAALEAGSGEDSLVIESSIAIEGTLTGTEEVSVEAVEAPPPVLAPTPVEEVKPMEDAESVIASDAGPSQENVVNELKEEVVEEEKPKEVAMVEQPPIVPVEEKEAAGKKQSGGDVTALNAYRGTLFKHLSTKKVNPRTKQSGTAKVKISFDPLTGKLISHEISQSSGFEALDKAALASIERAAPFPPLPANLASGPFEVTVPFKFSVR